MKLRAIKSPSKLDMLECFNDELAHNPCIFIISSDGIFNHICKDWLNVEHIQLALGIMNNFNIYFKSLK